ncbi:MAG: peptide chain release factor 3 [Eubacteriales bacterium]|nr:peptide chain release factor 3 [Eubacteriales bacterium]
MQDKDPENEIRKRVRDEVGRRKTFAIISHPDAGKTTLTEKLLLYGGAIRLAGSVKARKANKYAVSDWMEIEKQRGISVTSSVLQFRYNNYCINILDTPGHQDFSEDTYRTLVAADSAVMLIDGAKGVEEQTIKLFHVCRMRGIPIFTFINKMDRASKEPLALMQELEDVLGIRSCPMNWPVGTEGDFAGVYNRQLKQIEVYGGSSHGQTEASVDVVSVGVGFGNGEDGSNPAKDLLGEYLYSKLKDDVELLDMAGDDFDTGRISRGELTPVFFGSAMNNFGVKPFLEEFLKYAPAPGIRTSSSGEVDPEDAGFTGFVFKIQANMNPTHRDRLAFIRICSGSFSKGMEVYQPRTGRKVRLTQPQQMMAQDRVIIDEAYAGDIIGIFDPGIFKLGDTLSENDPKLRYEGIPLFPAEHFARVMTVDSMKRKQFLKGIDQLSEEGAIQVFRQPDIGVETLVIGAVGVLQFEVLEYRLKHEYGVDIKTQILPHKMARWITGGGAGTGAGAVPFAPGKLNITSSTMITTDDEGRFVLLFENIWSERWALEKNKGLELADIVPVGNE